MAGPTFEDKVNEILNEFPKDDDWHPIPNRKVQHALYKWANKMGHSLAKEALGSWASLPELAHALYDSGILGGYNSMPDRGWDEPGDKYYVPPGMSQDTGAIPNGEFNLAPTEGFGTSGLVRAGDMWPKVAATVGKRLLRTIVACRKRNSYASYLVATRATESSLPLCRQLIFALKALILPESPKVGPRMMSVRKWKYGVGWGKHAGNWALKRAPGRQALSGSEWIRRKMGRDRARPRKTSRRWKKHKVPTPPKTKHPRPYGDNP